jgi:hypothetical protein
MPQHIGRKSMPELMRPFGGRIDPSATDRTSNNAVNRRWAHEATDRSIVPQKQATVRASGAAVLEISNNRFADLRE